MVNHFFIFVLFFLQKYKNKNKNIPQICYLMHLAVN